MITDDEHSGGGEPSPDQFAEISSRIRADLEASQSSVRISAAAMTMQLRPEIRAARARGVSYREIAAIFKTHGLCAEPDAIRIALGRNVVTKAARARAANPATVLTQANTPAPSGSAPQTPSERIRADGANIVRRIK